MLTTSQTTWWAGTGACGTSLASLIPLSKSGLENVSPNVAILPRHRHVRPIRLSDADSGQDHDPSGKTVAGPFRQNGEGHCSPQWWNTDSGQDHDPSSETVAGCLPANPHSSHRSPVTALLQPAHECWFSSPHLHPCSKIISSEVPNRKTRSSTF